jgi:hypothetical protein
MGATVVFRHDLDVLKANVPVRIFVLNANVGEMYLLVKVRQVVLACPGGDLGFAAIGSAIAVVIAAIAFLEKPLVVAFQLAIQLHPLDARTSIAQALGSFQVSPIELRVVATLAGAIGTGTELLAVACIAGAMSFEERAAAVRKGNGPLLVVNRHALDEPLLFEPAQVAIAHVKGRIVSVAQVPLGDDPKRAHGRQRARI